MSCRGAGPGTGASLAGDDAEPAAEALAGDDAARQLADECGAEEARGVARQEEDEDLLHQLGC